MLYSFNKYQPVIGTDTYVSEHALVIGDVQIGSNCYIGHGAILRGDYGRIEIGDGTAVEEGVIIHAPPKRVCKIGEKVTLGHGAIIHSSNIGNQAVIGMGAVLSLGAKIGDGSIVAESAVVTMRQTIPDRVIVMGNPAKFVRKVTQEDEEYWNIGKDLYINLAKEYLKKGIQREERRIPESWCVGTKGR